MAKEYEPDGIVFLRSQNIRPFRLILSDALFVGQAFHNKLRKSQLHPGDVVIVRTGYPGTAAVVPFEVKDANCADLVIARPSDELDAWFLAGLFNSAWGRARVSGSLVGVAQQHFNVTVAKEVEINLPRVSIQRKIGRILATITKLIENNERRIRILDEIATSVFNEWFLKFRFPGHEKVKLIDSETHLGKIPEGWGVDQLSAVVGEIVLGGTPSRDQPEYWGGDIPWIKSGQLNDTRVIGGTEYITKAGLEQSATKMMPKRTVLIAITGAILVSMSEIELCANQSVVGVHTSDKLCQEYLYLFEKSHINQFVSKMSGSAQQHVNKEIVRNSLILVPHKEVMSKFEKMAKPIFDEIGNLLFKNSELERTRDLLLPRLISGALDVSNLDITTEEDQP